MPDERNCAFMSFKQRVTIEQIENTSCQEHGRRGEEEDVPDLRGLRAESDQGEKSVLVQRQE